MPHSLDTPHFTLPSFDGLFLVLSIFGSSEVWLLARLIFVLKTEIGSHECRPGERV